MYKMIPKALLVTCVWAACSNVPDPVEGDWSVMSRFYSAHYRISDEGRQLKCQVVNYDDGTTRYRYEEGDRQMISEHLVRRGDEYVDGVSGATTTDGRPSKISLKLTHADTVVVSQRSMGRTWEEKWIRKKTEE